MSANLIYNTTTGVITNALILNVPADILSEIITTNTPVGSSAIQVADDHPAITDHINWNVVNGVPTEIVPTNAQLLAAAQATQVSSITNSYGIAITTPVSYMSTTFRCDSESQVILAHALTVYNQIGSTPTGFYFLDTANNQVAMTLPQLQGLGAAVASQYLAAFQKRVTLIDQIEVATTVAAVQAVVWS